MMRLQDKYDVQPSIVNELAFAALNIVHKQDDVAKQSTVNGLSSVESYVIISAP